jgi:serine/threonine protein phosphatase PrpC
MKFRSAALSDIGRVRRQNEDRYLRDEALHAYGVADGVGGLPGGADAARTTIEAIQEALSRQPPKRAVELVPIVQAVNDSVSALGEDISPGVGIGTTLTFGVIKGEKLLLAHVGDSRCYRVRGKRIEMLTEDHSVENEARHRRARGESAEFSERFRHALTRCIGQPVKPEVDVKEFPLTAGDVFLFASDGVTRVIDDRELAVIVGGTRPLEERLTDLITRVNERGGPDNATAVLVEITSPK